MALTPGAKLGVTKSSHCAAMGGVYCVRDTRLGRDVAIKVLPAAYSADAERLRRFEQEASAASLLNR
jgi:eukaryotic-like serine/threonine-protein kinase